MDAVEGGSSAGAIEPGARTERIPFDASSETGDAFALPDEDPIAVRPGDSDRLKSLATRVRPAREGNRARWGTLPDRVQHPRREIR